MKCNYCGAEIADNAFFCVVCGKTITRSDGKNRRKVDLSKPCDNNLNLDSDVFDDSSDVTWRAFDFDPPMYSEETVSVPENTILLEEPSIVNPQFPEEPSIVNPQFPEEPSIMNTYLQEEPQMIRILPEESKQNQNVSFDLQQNGVLPDGERQVIPPPVQRQTIPPQNAVTAPDINAMRNNVIAGFAYRHYNKADYFGKVEGQPKSFTLFGNTLTITPDKDAFNTYRLKFRDLAFRYTNKFIREYSLLVVNLETFVQYFPALYLSNMEYVIHTAMDVLAGENIWTQTFASFYQRHSASYHEAMDVYQLTVNNIDLTLLHQPRIMQNNRGYMPGAAIGFSGTNGIAVSEDMATGMNYARNVFAQNSVKAAGLSIPQKTQIFRRIVPSVLFHKVFTDYWQVFLSVVGQLRESGRNIWIGTNEMAQQTDNMFRNLSNPRFPQEQTPSLLLKMLGLFPYNKPVFFRMTRMYGDTPEISAVRQYFGYTDLGNPRII